MDLNRVVLIGRMSADPELKMTQSNKPVLSFRIAVNKLVKAGEHPEANWIDCVAWKGTAEFIAKYFNKGSKIAVEGKLNTRSWEDNNGNKRKTVEVVVDSAFFVEKKSDTRADYNADVSISTGYDTEESKEGEEGGDDTLPF